METFAYPRLSVGLGSVRGREFILSPKVKGRVLGICVIYDTFVIVLLSAPVSQLLDISLTVHHELIIY